MGVANEAIGQNIRALRHNRGWSQAEFSARLRQHPGLGAFHLTAVSRTESGSRPLRLTEAVEIAEVLDVPLSWITHGPNAPELDRIAWSLCELEERAKDLAERTTALRAQRLPCPR